MNGLIDKFYSYGKIDKNGNLIIEDKIQLCKYKKNPCNNKCVSFIIKEHGRYGINPNEIDSTSYLHLCDNLIISIEYLKLIRG